MATQMDPFIQKLLYGGQPTPFDFMQGPMQQKIGTPGINPNAPDPRLTRGDVAQPQKPGMLGTIDKFLTSPGGGFLMNLLADSGYSPVPQSPMGSVGRAALMTQQQQQARGMTEAQRRLIESQIGVNQREMNEPYDGGKPLTDLAKLRQDFESGRIGADVYEAKRREVLRTSSDKNFDMTKSLRGEFRTDTDGLRNSQTALASAKSLLANNNPVAATAAFTSFIRSIDNSVVRPAEQAAYSSASGLAIRLQDELSKIKGQGPLSETTRRNLLDSIEALEGQLQGIYDRTVQFYNSEADVSKLRPESVTGIPQITSPDITIDDPDDSLIPPQQELIQLRERINALPDGPVKQALLAELEQTGG
jgi:hypothetical protein